MTTEVLVPAPVDSPQSVPPPPQRRPKFLTLLSLLHMCSGMGVLVLIATTPMGGAERISSLLGYPRSMVAIAFAVVGVLDVGAGVGMWLGNRWGWWLAAIYYVHAILRSAHALLVSLVPPAEWGEPDHGWGGQHLKFTGRVFINSLILLYLYGDTCARYFHMEELPVRKSLAKLVGAAFTVGSVTYILAKLLS
jgi:hypothetical protein